MKTLVLIFLTLLLSRHLHRTYGMNHLLGQGVDAATASLRWGFESLLVLFT